MSYFEIIKLYAIYKNTSKGKFLSLGFVLKILIAIFIIYLALF